MKRASLSDLSVPALLDMHAKVLAELRRRGICRTSNNPVADIAEGLVAKALGLTLASGSTKGFDATDSRGRRYEIKARRITALSKATMLGAIRGLEKGHFDFLVAVIFNENYSVQKAVQMPRKTVERIARFRGHDNAHRIIIRDMWQAEGARDITARLLKAV